MNTAVRVWTPRLASVRLRVVDLFMTLPIKVRIYRVFRNVRGELREDLQRTWARSLQ